MREKKKNEMDEGGCMCVVGEKKKERQGGTWVVGKKKGNKREKIKAKLHNHPLGFDSVANRPPGVLTLQYNHLGFLNW